MAGPASSTEQRAAKRKSHRKSRNGCFQCKQRHTKCSETHPRCSNCMRLDIECTWPSRERYSATGTAYPTPPESHETAPLERRASKNEIQQETFGSDMSITDLRLLHHWSTSTCMQMSPEIERVKAWQHAHTEVALDHPFLLRGILAVAAVHKAVTKPDSDRKTLITQADDHISKALVTYRQNMAQPKPETAVAMFLLSTVLVAYYLAATQLETQTDPISTMCIRLLQGVRAVVQSHSSQVLNSQIYKDLVVDKPAPIGADPVEEVLRLKKLAKTKKTQAGEVYTKAIGDLNDAFVRVRNCSPDDDTVTIALAWSSDLSEPFIQLLVAHDPIAVLIFSHFAVLVSECCDNWWLRNFPQRIVLVTQKLLMSTPELLEYLDWPLQAIAKT
ncbi:hypothetical protein CC80DRAFT_567533 [Byssothecium circinans]|uniref:Zn(2)-C6 fungal-type domain-containing protein n=1 Tax=Byssothecium circinans TaxID=147558 RepID=A0A6A5TZG5_9PLEO|nr:hypothetical protein CC80DRAFT_567533 [Byssothecium circinans]